MDNYQINTEEINRIIELLNLVLKIRITFFDLHEEELSSLNIPENFVFCRTRRRDPEFNALCVECDKRNLDEAKKKKSIHIYHCHAGLLEGIVPLYDRNGIYLGAIVFGQLCDEEFELPSELREYRKQIKKTSKKTMYNIALLLKYLGEYICENELLKRCMRPWSIRMEEYIAAHLNQKITLKDLSVYLGMSVSFLSHSIPLEFGMSLKKFIRKKRMEKAIVLLKKDMIVRECAFELGYADEFYFSRDFKKYYGFPPSEMKKELSRKNNLHFHH